MWYITISAGSGSGKSVSYNRVPIPMAGSDPQRYTYKVGKPDSFDFTKWGDPENYKQVKLTVNFKYTGGSTQTYGTGGRTRKKLYKPTAWANTGSGDINVQFGTGYGSINSTEDDGTVKIKAINYTKDTGTRSSPTNPTVSAAVTNYIPGKTNYTFIYGKNGSDKRTKDSDPISQQISKNTDIDYSAVYASLYTVHFDVNPPVDIRYTDGTSEEVNCVPNDIVCAYLDDASDGKYLRTEDNKQYIHHYPGRGLKDQDPNKPRLILKDYDVSYWSYDKEGKQKVGVPGNADENLIKNLKKDGNKPNPGDTIVLYAQGVPVMRKINYKSYDSSIVIPENDPPENPGTSPYFWPVEPKSWETTWIQDHQPEYDLSAPHRGGTLSNNGIVNLLPNDEYGHRTGHEGASEVFVEAAKAHSVIYGYDPKAPILGVGKDTSYKLHPAGQPLIGVNDGGPDLATGKELESRPAPNTYDRIFYAVGKPASLVKMPSPSGIIGRPIHQIGVMTSEGGKVLDMVYLDTSEGIRPITGGAS